MKESVPKKEEVNKLKEFMEDINDKLSKADIKEKLSEEDYNLLNGDLAYRALADRAFRLIVDRMIRPASSEDFKNSNKGKKNDCEVYGAERGGASAIYIRKNEDGKVFGRADTIIAESSGAQRSYRPGEALFFELQPKLSQEVMQVILSLKGRSNGSGNLEEKVMSMLTGEDWEAIQIGF